MLQNRPAPVALVREQVRELEQAPELVRALALAQEPEQVRALALALARVLVQARARARVLEPAQVLELVTETETAAIPASRVVWPVMLRLSAPAIQSAAQ